MNIYKINIICMHTHNHIHTYHTVHEEGREGEREGEGRREGGGKEGVCTYVHIRMHIQYIHTYCM